MLFDAQPSRECVFSPDRRYRYRLCVTTGASDGPAVNVLMLNPSIADEQVNDPTIERICRRAFIHGILGRKYDRLIVTNLFALVSTDPKGLMAVDNPAGNPENNQQIVAAARESELTICGWGEHGARYKRAGEVLDILARLQIVTYAFELNASGHPKHPLYVSYKHDAKRWDFKRGVLLQD